MQISLLDLLRRSQGYLIYVSLIFCYINPGKDGNLFSQNHPYYPEGCLSCPFAGNRLKALYHDLAAKQDCHKCQGVNAVVDKANGNIGIIERLKRLQEATGKEYVDLLRDIIARKEFKPIRKNSNIFSAISTKADDYPNLFNAARKLLGVEDKVYILPNPGDTRKPDLICVRKGSIRAYDVKTISGRNSVGNRLEESIGQTNRVVLNMTVEYNPRGLYREIKKYFNAHSEAIEVIILVGKRQLAIKREMPSIHDFIMEYGKKK